MKVRMLAAWLAAGMILTATAAAQTVPPAKVSYQGRVMSSGMPHNGLGWFKYSLCDAMGMNTYWSTAGPSGGCGLPAGPPVSLMVNQGLYQVPLGDATLPGMNLFPPDLFTHGDLYLRVWFSGDGSTFEQLDPLQPVTSVFNALNASLLWGMTPGQLRAKQPNTIVVAPSGGDTTKIKGGLNLAAASPGADLVLVAPGNYAEDWLFVPSNVTIRCMVERQCVLSPPSGMGFDLMAASNVRIEGFAFQNAFEAIHLDPGPAQNIEVASNDFNNCSYGLDQMAGGATVNNVIVRDNRFYNFTMGSEAKGVALKKVNMVLIEDNNMSNFSASLVRPIEIEQGIAVTVRNNIMGQNQGMGGPSASCNIAFTNVTFGWIENNRMKDPSGMQMKGICVYTSNYVKIDGNDLVLTAPMMGTGFDGIYAERSEGMVIENNRVLNFWWPDAVGIRLRDPGNYRVAGNLLREIGDPIGGPNTAWGIVMESRGVPPMLMFKAKQVIQDNQIERCGNGIRLDYSSMPEMTPIADKAIKGNVILDGHSVGDGILLLEAANVQVLENKVVGHKYGLRAQYMMTAPNPLHVMRNEFWNNIQADFDLTMMSGIARVFYNFMNVFNRPLGGTVVEAYNVNGVGGTP